MTSAAYSSKELSVALEKKGIEAHRVMRFEKGGGWYYQYTYDIICRWLREVHGLHIYTFRLDEKEFEVIKKDIFIMSNENVLNNNNYMKLFFIKRTKKSNSFIINNKTIIFIKTNSCIVIRSDFKKYFIITIIKSVCSLLGANKWD